MSVEQLRVPTRPRLSFLLASLAGSVLSLTRLGTGFVRTKVAAVLLGTAGIGLLAQGNQLHLLAISLGNLGIPTGIINRLAAAIKSGNPRRQRQVLATAFTSQLTVTGLLMALAFVAAGPIARYALGSEQEAPKLYPIILGLPFAVLSAGYLQSVLFALGRYDLYVRSSIGALVAALAVFVGLVRVWGVTGAFWGLFFSPLLLFLAFLYMVAQLKPLREVFAWGFDSVECRELLAFAAVMLVSAGIGYVGTLVIRTRIIEVLGVAANGIMQVPIATSGYLAPLFTNALWGRLHPVVGTHGDAEESQRELTVALRSVAVFAAAAILGLLVFREWFVRLAYSRQFLEAARLMPLQLAGDYFFLVSYPFSVYFLGANRLRVYLVGTLLQNVLLVVPPLVLLASHGLIAVPLGYFVSSLAVTLAGLAWLLVADRLKAAPVTALLIIVCGAVVLAEYRIAGQTSSLAARAVVPMAYGVLVGLALLRPGLRQALLGTRKG